MADLIEAYTDVRDRTHRVEHTVIPAEDRGERIIEELICALTKTEEKTSA